MKVDFKGSVGQYLSLYRKPGVTVQRKYSDSLKKQYAGYNSFWELSEENGLNFDMPKFIEQYKNRIGDYYTFNRITKNYDYIKDEKILNYIKDSEKEYNDEFLKNDTDISNIYASVKKTIVAQDQQIKQILTSIFKNQKVINSSLDNDIVAKLKENLIIYGSTGTGKTEILKRISKIYKVPIVIEDATSLSETGYVGRSIEDMIKNLYLAAGKNISKAEKGILVIDEFDKLSEKERSNQVHVSRGGVQRGLLKLLDGTKFYLDEGKVIDTSKITIIALGAFTGITKDDDYSKVDSTKFVEYGIMRELMGRFSKTIAMNPLNKEDIKKILLESDFSPLNTYSKLFESMNIKFNYDEEFVDYVAEKAVNLKSGARSLKTIFDNEIGGAMFRIFAGEYSEVSLTKPNENGISYVLTEKKDNSNKPER